jgi:hypothetical protein
MFSLTLVIGCARKDVDKEVSEKATEAQDRAIAAQDRASAEQREAVRAQAAADLRSDQAAVAAAQAAQQLHDERDKLLTNSTTRLRAFDQRLAILEARANKDASAEARAWVTRIRATRAQMDEITRQALAADSASWAAARDRITAWVNQLQTDLDWGEQHWPDETPAQQP